MVCLCLMSENSNSSGSQAHSSGASDAATTRERRFHIGKKATHEKTKECLPLLHFHAVGIEAVELGIWTILRSLIGLIVGSRKSSSRAAGRGLGPRDRPREAHQSWDLPTESSSLPDPRRIRQPVADIKKGRKRNHNVLVDANEFEKVSAHAQAQKAFPHGVNPHKVAWHYA
mmetsp:Transcript_14487/g.33457  ORF Transcript_14487/g.33457 Transcript_14487/m.33457 type:complete len:172 (-) Transcript_14487:43-558(-)